MSRSGSELVRILVSVHVVAGEDLTPYAWNPIERTECALVYRVNVAIPPGTQWDAIIRSFDVAHATIFLSTGVGPTRVPAGIVARIREHGEREAAVGVVASEVTPEATDPLRARQAPCESTG